MSVRSTEGLVIRSDADLNRDRIAAILGRDDVRGIKIWNCFDTAMSRVAYVGVKYERDGSDGPFGLFIKMARIGTDGKPTGSGRKEVRFYTELTDLINDRHVPRCHYARHDDDGHYSIVLDDLAPTHESAECDGDRLVSRYRKAILCLAGIHASWWNNPGLDARIGPRRSAASCHETHERSLAEAERFMSRRADMIPPEDARVWREHAGLYKAVNQRYLSGRHLTLAHRDPHYWNFMYPKEGEGEVYLIDWDCYRIDVGTNDIAYFMAVHWDREKRARLERPLLDLYYGELLRLGVTGYSRADLEDDYRVSVLSMLFLSAVKERLGLPPEVWLTQFSNVMAALVDLDCRSVAERILENPPC